jgi:uncharacterized membrane protein
MTWLAFCLIMLSLLLAVAGQIFFKLAMSDHVVAAFRVRVFRFVCGIVVMTIGFFIWLGLLSRFNLSFLYPFEGIDRILLAFFASWFLHEKMTLDLWLGVILISVGVALVATS